MSLTFSTSVIVQHFRGGSRTAATSKVKLFMIIVNGGKPLTLFVPAVLHPPLHFVGVSRNLVFKSVSPPTSK